MRAILGGLLGLAVLLSGCSSNLSTIPARKQETQRITLGAAQSQLKNGMTGDEVIAVMGSPEIVTQQEDKSETWVYDKNFSEQESASGLFSSVETKSQKSFIVTIKFDTDRRVKDISYRQTSY
jgi:outer membrane protein assembly factor BamE (lipoprotein component of BamABCDE complex)